MAWIASSWLRSANLSRSGAGDLELVADLVGLLAHLLAGEGVGQAVVHHRVERLGVAHAVAEARAPSAGRGPATSTPCRRPRPRRGRPRARPGRRSRRARGPRRRPCSRSREETSLGMPPLIWAWRLGIWPCPAWSTWPKTTCCTCSGATSARSSAAAIAVPPRSVASRVERPPPILPNGVRAAPRITVLGIGCVCLPGRLAGPRTLPTRSAFHRLRPPMARCRGNRRAAAPRRTPTPTRAWSPLFEGESLDEPELQALVDSGEAKAGLQARSPCSRGRRRRQRA